FANLLAMLVITAGINGFGNDDIAGTDTEQHRMPGIEGVVVLGGLDRMGLCRKQRGQGGDCEEFADHVDTVIHDLQQSAASAGRPLKMVMWYEQPLLVVAARYAVARFCSG